MTAFLMVQGTSSGAGKSLLVAALCRIFARMGIDVAPFKAQNMSLNSGVTPDGGELGRAQIVQAIASKKAPSILMNPILLKPEGNTMSQLVVMGRSWGSLSAMEYYSRRSELWRVVKSSISELSREVELVVIEGAGNPAEINLMDRDIVNMRVARLVDASVLLVGDIERGGVFASLYGTIALLGEDARYIKGIVINRFRGDSDILEPGIRKFEEMVGVPVLGVVPYVKHAIDEEDSISDRLSSAEVSGTDIGVRIGVVRLAFMSNYTDFLPLEEEDGVSLIYFDPDLPPSGLDVVIVPGSKNTLADLQVLKRAGFDTWLRLFKRRGGVVVGICGGYQILGKEIYNPYGVEVNVDGMQALGLLNVKTTLQKQKSVYLVKALMNGIDIVGYEIHVGTTLLEKGVKPFLKIVERNGVEADVLDGAISPDGKVWGTYVHGIFDNCDFRRWFINSIRLRKGLPPIESECRSWMENLDKELDRFADIVERHVDIESILCMLSL